MQGKVIKTADGYRCLLQLLLDHEVQQVWDALTKPTILSRWLADAAIDLRPGGPVELRYSNSGSVVTGRITEIQPPYALEFTWNSTTGAAPDSRVRWQLRPERHGTCLTLSHSLQTCEDLAAMLAGWHAHLEGLERAIAGQQVEWPWERWHELHAMYQEQVSRGQ